MFITNKGPDWGTRESFQVDFSMCFRKNSLVTFKACSSEGKGWNKETSLDCCNGGGEW